MNDPVVFLTPFGVGSLFTVKCPSSILNRRSAHYSIIINLFANTDCHVLVEEDPEPLSNILDGWLLDKI